MLGMNTIQQEPSLYSGLTTHADTISQWDGRNAGWEEDRLEREDGYDVALNHASQPYLYRFAGGPMELAALE